MRAVKSTNTKPEIIVRKTVHALGFRFRLYAKDLPGKPDLVFRKSRKVILVNGCFWHGHDCPRGARIPSTNITYWLNKIAKNQSRDQKNLLALQHLGFTPLVLWECELKDMEKVRHRLKRFLANE